MSDASSQYMTESTVKWSDFYFEKEAESAIILFSGKEKGSSGFLIFKLRVWEHELSSAMGVLPMLESHHGAKFSISMVPPLEILPWADTINVSSLHGAERMRIALYSKRHLQKFDWLARSSWVNLYWAMLFYYFVFCLQYRMVLWSDQSIVIKSTKSIVRLPGHLG